MIQNQMKRIAFIIALVLCVFQSNAQGNQVAVLYHGNEFYPFYSTDGFKQALAKAENGDVITLSPGTFIATNITKAVTIRGAGIGAVDTLATVGTPLTQISGDVQVKIPEDVTNYTLSIEGVRFESSFSLILGQNLIFSKCYFKSISSSSGANVKNVALIQCVVTSFSTNSFGMNFYHCMLYGLSSATNSTFNNCTVEIPSSAVYFMNSSSGNEVRNSIFINGNSSKSFSFGTHAYVTNTIWVGYQGNSLAVFSGENASAERMNFVLPKGTEIFKKGTFYELNENGLKYKGSDGSQIGIYGSDLPFSVKTSYPQIKKFKITPESTDDGKLKIEFEIDADN